MKRWVVKIEESDLKKLNPQLLSVGTLINTEDGEQYMVFRENFSAIKLASALNSMDTYVSTGFGLS